MCWFNQVCAMRAAHPQDEGWEDGGVERPHAVDDCIRSLQLGEHPGVGHGCHLVLMRVSLCRGSGAKRRAGRQPDTLAQRAAAAGWAALHTYTGRQPTS